ncbi:MAG TPA: hypothetical protein VIV58_38905, partial [Kofleriaceae bacterium]
MPECTLACTADTDCIAGQACSHDGFCAASAETQCTQRQTPGDSAAPGVDAGSGVGSGSGSGSGGTTTVSVHVTVHGPGKVIAST